MVCHMKKMKVVVDSKLLSNEFIYGGGGKRDKLLKLRTKDVIRLNNALVAQTTE